MRDIDAIARDGTGTGDNVKDMMKDSIKQIKVLALLLAFQFHTQDNPERKSRLG